MTNKNQALIQKIVASQQPKALMEKFVREQRQAKAKREAVNDMLSQLVDAGLFDHVLSPPAQVEGGVYAPDEIEQAEQIAAALPTGDDLAYKAHLREEFKKSITDEAPFVRINPFSVLRGTLGNAAIVASADNVLAPGTSSSINAVTGSTDVQFLPRRATVANWLGRDEESLPVSVAFMPLVQLIQPDSGVGARSQRSFGIVKFGTRAFQAEVEVDIGAGTQFTVPGSAVQLLVALEDHTGSGSPSFMQLSGMLSFYPIVRTTPVTRTRYVDALGVNAKADFTVPAMAKDVVFVRVLESETATLSFKTVDGSIAYEVKLVANTEMVPVRLSPDIVQVEVHDTGGNGLNGRLIFGLSL